VGLIFKAARVLRGEIRLEKAMILNVLTLAAARAAQGSPKRGADVASLCRHLHGLAQ